jgi:uncharacterized protein (DUF1778 family)
MPEAAIREVTSRSSKSARLDVRLRDEDREMIERAAAISGSTLSEYVIRALIQWSRQTINEYEQMHLSRRDAETFIHALANPPAPSERLLRAVQSTKE